jgi:hypothetical protein
MIIDRPHLVKAGVSGITFVGANVGTVDSEVTLPTMLEDDFCMIFASADGNFSANTGGTGWTDQYYNNAGSNTRMISKVMGSTPDSGTHDWGAGCSLIAVAFRGVDTTTPLDVAITADSAGSGTVDCPSITTVTDGCAIIAMGALDDDDATGVSSPPSGYGDFQEVFISGDNVTGLFSWKLQTTAGAENPGVYDTGSFSDAWCGNTIALRPAS